LARSGSASWPACSFGVGPAAAHPLPSIAPEPERELESLRRIAAELSRTSDVEGVARALLDEIAVALSRGLRRNLRRVGRRERGVWIPGAGGGKGRRLWRELRLDLAREPSGIASAVYEVSSFAVYDVSGSTRVSSRTRQRRPGRRALHFVPLVSEGQVIAVISVATTDDYRAFSSPDDLSVMQTLASEATIALERTRSTIALGEALERERLLATIGRRLRTELDVDDALALTVAETGQAIGASRCFVRLGDGLPLAAQWTAPGATPVGDDPDQLPLVSNPRGGDTSGPLRSPTCRTRRSSPSPSLGDVAYLRALGARAVASTPMVAQTGRSASSPRIATPSCVEPRRTDRCSRPSPPRQARESGSAACSPRTRSNSPSRRLFSVQPRC